MEKIIFYKLVSPYPEDETKNCNLTMSEIDSNFLTLKDYDIKNGLYNNEPMSINLYRNNGEKINISLSGLDNEINERIDEALSGLTPCSGMTEIIGSLSDDGVLTLTLSGASGENSTVISGFTTTSSHIFTNETLSGVGVNGNPLRVSNNEKTGKYMPVDGIVGELPSDNRKIGDRYITKKTISKFGRLYSLHGMEMVEGILQAENSIWRIPSKEDWNKLLDYAEECSNNSHESGNDIGYSGDIAGKVLKSISYWEGNQNLDFYGFSVVPSGFVHNDVLENVGYEAKFWTSSESNESKYIKWFTYNHDNVLQFLSSSNDWYSIRLVTTIDNPYAIGDSENILGDNYKILIFPSINQAWIAENLRYNPSNEYSEQYAYPYSGITSEKYAINHWNGNAWESKELKGGDEVNASSNGNIQSFVVSEDANGNQVMIDCVEYKSNNDDGKIIMDYGWW